MDPIPCINLEIVKDMNKYFLILEVEPGNETPYYVVGSGGGRTAYIRIGNESVPASSNDIRNLALKGMNKSFDSLSSHILIDKASFTKLKVEYYKRTKKEFRDTDFLSFGLADQENILTNAGALFADEHLLLQSRVFCTRWNGNDKANGKMEATDDNEFEGNLLELLKNTLSFVSLNTRKSWRKVEVYRLEEILL